MREEPVTTLSEVSDAWLVGRARELNAAGQHGEPSSQRTTVREADSLLMEAQRRGEPRIVAQLLRHCASMRLANSALADEADPLLDELLHHTKRHGLEVLRADAHALRGKHALLVGSEDRSLTEVAQGLALLEDELAPDRALGRRSWERLLATSLIDLGLVLTQLGAYEMADQVMASAHQRIRASGGPHEIAVHMINRCRMQLAWGLRLERVGLDEEAAGQFSTASAIAFAVETPWRESLFPRTSNRSAGEQMPVLGAAHALDEPGPEHIPKLQELRQVDRSMHPREQILIAIALSRCLVRSERQDEAARVLSDTLENLVKDTSEQTLRISLARELANLTELPDRPRDSLRTYTLELEKELWAMRETRVSTLETRLENSRLNNKHEAISKQANEDPLTGLFNRRALDDQLETLLHSAGDQPMAVALVDLDGFKGVNDRCSHAEGDDVLRNVAAKLRETLRTDDFLARYGGDEFVVLLPGATLDAAEVALNRTVSAVHGLSRERSRGVTLSIGVVALRRQESAAQALARADAAMYQAKRNGGNRVAALSAAADAERPHPSEIDQAVWTPPDAR